MAKTTVDNVTRFLRGGYAVATWTNPYDGVSAVSVDPDGMVRSALPTNGPMFAMALEVGGRGMNLLFPYRAGSCCAHGFVTAKCACGLKPVSPNPARGGSA